MPDLSSASAISASTRSSVEPARRAEELDHPWWLTGLRVFGWRRMNSVSKPTRNWTDETVLACLDVR